MKAVVLLLVLMLTSCNTRNKSKQKKDTTHLHVTAQTETEPIPRDSTIDAADDPAIWINFSKPDSSRIIGTDKQGGLAVYNLSGHELFYYNTGKMNNADLRYGFPLNSDTIDILAASNRSEHSVDLFKINQNGSLEVIHKNRLQSGIKTEVYGLCMYKSRITARYYVFVNGLDGEIEQWELYIDNKNINGKIVRNLKLDSQVEGMVADDETGTLYVGEEDRGIWKFNAEPKGKDDKELLLYSTIKTNNFIKYDIEGLAIYKLQNDDGYILASSQGNNSYIIFERRPPHNCLGSFKIVNGIGIDGTEVTDGIEVTNIPLGKSFPSGLLVVQDGINVDKDLPAAQNFKLVRWDSIAVKFNPPLKN